MSSTIRGKERILIYGSFGLRKGISDLLWSFRKAHKLEEFPSYLDDHPLPVLKRVKNELQHDMETADVVVAPHYLILRMANEGLLGEYRSPELSAYPDWAKDDEGRWTGVGVTTMFPAYNTRLVPQARKPTDFDDLAERYSDDGVASQAMVTSSAGNLTTLYLSSLKRVLGNERWNVVVDLLADRIKPPAYDCIDHLLQAVSEDKHPIALAVYSLAYYRVRKDKPYIKRLEMQDLPSMWTMTSAGVVKGAEENESVHHFMDHLLSNEGQETLSSIDGVFPARENLIPEDKRGAWDEAHFFPLERELEEMETTTQMLSTKGLR